MLADVAAAHPLTYGVLRYFNVAGADPQEALGPVDADRDAPDQGRVRRRRSGSAPKMDIFGTDYPTPDGTCVRDYIHVTDLVEAHALLLDHLRGGRRQHDAQLRLRAGLFGAAGDRHGEVGLGRRFRASTKAPRRAGDPAVDHGDRRRRCGQLLGWEPAARRPRRDGQTALDWEQYLVTRNR